MEMLRKPQCLPVKLVTRICEMLLLWILRYGGGLPQAVCLLANDVEITADTVIRYYCQGMFPIVEEDKGHRIVQWYNPLRRAVIPIGNVHAEKNSRRLLKKNIFTFRFDTAFADVVRACSEREDSWVDSTVQEVYTELHGLGAAHSVEAWKDEELVGGGYGVTIGGLFVGESMFYRVKNAAKLSFLKLDEHLAERGYLLHDAQFLTAHLQRLGAYEIAREEYLQRLARAVVAPVTFG
jgi:leucyl/phenylalanyl-tRNA--protein transferase